IYGQKAKGGDQPCGHNDPCEEHSQEGHSPPEEHDDEHSVTAGLALVPAKGGGEHADGGGKEQRVDGGSHVEQQMAYAHAAENEAHAQQGQNAEKRVEPEQGVSNELAEDDFERGEIREEQKPQRTFALLASEGISGKRNANEQAVHGEAG